jgi:hypothetical protein
LSAAEAIFAVAKTMVFMTQIIIAKANKTLSVDKKILFVPPTVLRARQPVHCGSRCCNLIKNGLFDNFPMQPASAVLARPHDY